MGKVVGREACDLEQAWEFEGDEKGQDASVGALRCVAGTCK